MQALNFQLDLMTSDVAMRKGLSGAVQGSNSAYQDGTSFRKMLESAQSGETTEGKNTLEKNNDSVKTSSTQKENPEAQVSDSKVVDKNQQDNAVEKNVSQAEKETTDVAEESATTKKSDESTEILLTAKDAELFNDFSVEEVEGVVDLHPAEENSQIVELTITEELPEEITESLEQIVSNKNEADEELEVKHDVSADEIIMSAVTNQPALNESQQVVLKTSDENSDLDSDGKNTLEASVINKAKTDKPVISVFDERTVEKTETTVEGKFVRTVTYDENNNAQVSLTLATPDNVADAQLGAELANTENPTNFQSMLSEELQKNAGELVKTGSVILKDGGKGTINLILHPEELGNVKIKLELSEKVIAGKIVVTSEEAYNAFKTSLPALKEAFAQSGFETSGFDLSWSGQQKEGNQQTQKNLHGFAYELNQNGFYEDDFSSSGIAEYYRDSLISVLV